MSITEFLTARYDEDERDAERMPDEDLYWHSECWDKARVLADIAAKRAIVALYESSGLRIAMGQVVRLLAQPYAEHPDFDPAWRVS